MLQSGLSERLSSLSSRDCFLDDDVKSSSITIATIRTQATSVNRASGNVTAGSDIYHGRLQCSERSAGNVDEVEAMFRVPEDRDYVSRMIFLTQDNSRRPLNTSGTVLETLMRKHCICTDFLRIVSAFYIKNKNEEETLCLPFQMYENKEYLEYFYIYKYVEHNGNPKDPWSLRQTGVYHQIRKSDQRSTYILISPRRSTKGQTALLEWMHSQVNTNSCQQQAFDVHHILLRCYVDEYRDFMGHFEEKIDSLSMLMLGIGLHSTSVVKPQDMASLNIIQVKLLPALYAAESLDEMIVHLETATQRWLVIRGKFKPVARQQAVSTLLNARNQMSAYRRGIEALMQRCSIAMQLLTGILDINNQTINQEQQLIARGQSDRMEVLTKLSVNDAATVQVISAISAVFLSFAVVAAIMAMPLFYLDKSTNRLAVSSSIWIYVTISVVLTIVILGSWQTWLSRKRKLITSRLKEGHEV